MWLCLESAVLLTLVYSVFGQLNTENSDCLSNKDCSNDKLCAEFKCINPCLLNLCFGSDPSECRVTNHIPVCGCKGCFSGPLNDRTASKSGKKKYQLILEKLNWHAALVNCTAQGKRLATIESQEDQDRLSDLAVTLTLDAVKAKRDDLYENLWLGGSDLHKSGDFMWVSSGKPFSYKHFRDGQPDSLTYGSGATDHCIGLWTKTSEWFDFVCEEKHYFACEHFE